jgi:hypothetical protein
LVLDLKALEFGKIIQVFEADFCSSEKKIEQFKSLFCDMYKETVI